MKISSINVILTEEDIMSFITDSINDEEFYIDEIKFDNGIKIKAKIKKHIWISILIYININKVEDNKLYVDIKKIKILGLPIFKFVINKVMDAFKEKAAEVNILIENNIAIVDVEKILEESSGFKVDIENIIMNDGQLVVSVKNVIVDTNKIGQAEVEEKNEIKTIDEVKNLIEEKKAEEKSNNNKEKENNLPILVEEPRFEKKKEDIYTYGRKVVKENIPERLKPYSEYILILPDLAALIGRLLLDDRVETKTKIIVTATLGYVIMPGDIIDDKIPFIGSIDDLGMVFFAINRIVNDVPLAIILENWEGEDEIVLIFRKTVEYLSKYTAAAKLEKIYSVIDTLKK